MMLVGIFIATRRKIISDHYIGNTNSRHFNTHINNTSKFHHIFFLQKELIREVEMGPFKHTVDDGLDIRKAAFECMYTLLDACLDRSV